MRVIAVFEKSERLRHIGHLDLMRAMQRALRRSGLPIAYSKGFNPHVLVTFASALSVGAVGQREVVDVAMAEDVSAETFVQVMNRALPPEMQIRSACVVDDRHPAAMALVAAAVYDIELTEQAEAITAAVPSLLAMESIPAIRKTKSGEKEVDIKPMVYGLSAEGNHLLCTLALTEAATCKPDMLISALMKAAGMEIPEKLPRTMITRKALLGFDADGSLVPVEEL